MTTERILSEILVTSLANAMAKIDPHGEGAPIQRLNDLAARAKSGFPMLVIARQGEYEEWGETQPSKFEEKVVDDAEELVDYLAYIKTNWTQRPDLSFYRLAAYSRWVDDEELSLHDGCQYDVMTSDEQTVVWGRVDGAAEKHLLHVKHLAKVKRDREDIARRSRQLAQDKAELALLTAKIAGVTT